MGFEEMLRGMRGHRKVSQVELAAAANVNINFIYQAENGKRKLTESEIARIRFVLEWPPELDGALETIFETRCQEGR